MHDTGCNREEYCVHPLSIELRDEEGVLGREREDGGVGVQGAGVRGMLTK